VSGDACSVVREKRMRKASAHCSRRGERERARERERHCVRVRKLVWMDFLTSGGGLPAAGRQAEGQGCTQARSATCNALVESGEKFVLLSGGAPGRCQKEKWEKGKDKETIRTISADCFFENTNIIIFLS
jgi:hypothetical protein